MTLASTVIKKSFFNINTFTNNTFEPLHEISNNVVCATSKASDQPAHKRSLVRAFASQLNSIWVLSYWLLSIKGGCLGSSESTLVKRHIVENHMSRLIWSCRKVEQRQPRITSQTYIVEPISTMLHTKA